MLRYKIVQLCRAALFAFFILLGSQKSGWAQVVPDDTLGRESSVLGTGRVEGDAVRMIEGGAARGGNLFHSFSEFNVGESEKVYFANPADIDNILSRVTGNALSTIDGVLGVDGEANLFFLNPNGIIFGPEAQLNINGSFTASTAGSFGFSGGGEFSAIAPETSLLSVSVPLGIQFNAQPQGDLTNAALLSVGQEQNLDLIGNRVSTNVLLSASGGVAQVWGNQIELVDREVPLISDPLNATKVIFQARDGITIPDVIDGELRFLDGTGDIQLIADADTDGVGDLVMVDVQDSWRANGRNLVSSGVNIFLGTIDTSSLDNVEKGGDISISSLSGDINTQDINSFSRSYSGDSRNGGNISIATNSGNISTQGINSFSLSYLEDSENGGDISISTISGDVSIQESVDSFSLSYGDSGNGGDISISTIDGDMSIQESVSSFSLSLFPLLSYSGNSGNGGDISITSDPGAVRIRGNLLSFSFAGSSSGAGGDILVLAGGNNSIEAISSDVVEGEIFFFSGSISASGEITAQGGDVVLFANGISGLQLLTLSSGGDSGKVDIQSVSDILTVTDVLIITTAQEEILSPLIFSDSIFRSRSEERIPLTLSNIGKSGNISLASTNGIVLDNVTIQSDANGSQVAGNIIVSSPKEVIFNNSEINSDTSSSGAAGNIRIDAARLSLGEGDRLSAETSAVGTGGTITVNTTESVSLGEGVQDSAPIISVEASGSGRPGNIVINTPSFVLSETARITATSTATATNPDSGGSISLNANQMDLAGTVGIFAETQGEAPGGILTLQPYQANLNNRNAAQPQSPAISSDAVLPSGSSFDLTLAEGSVISASATSSGDGGGLQLLAPDAITISGLGRLAVETSGSGQAGDVTATARSLTLADGVVLSASTTGEGNAGNINLNISDQLTIDNSTVESRTASNSTGQSGSINVNNAAQVSLLNGGNFTLNSEGTGEGGKFTLSADILTLDSGQITATTQSSNGGNFTFNLGDYLLLRNGSLISTEAGTARAGGNGGSITINTPDGFVTALPDENSDIRANAFEGNGGTVNITARNLLGIAFRPGLSDTPRSDITSSSQFGNSGIVTIDELNPETLQPEVELPVETAPATVARGCRAQGSHTGSFVSTGRGGLPTNPSDPLSPQSVWQDLEPLAELTDAPGAGGNSPQSTNSLQSTAEMVNSASEPITEAQHWSRAADGTVTLLAERAKPMTHLSQAAMCGS